MKYIIISLLTFCSLQCIGQIKYTIAEDGVYYIVPKQQAQKLDSLGRLSLSLDTILQNNQKYAQNLLNQVTEAKIEADREAIQTRGDLFKLNAETEALKEEYGAMHLQLHECKEVQLDLEEKADKYKDQRTRARNQRNLLIVGIVATTLTIILTN